MTTTRSRRALLAAAILLLGAAGAIVFAATANATTYECEGYECGPDFGPDPGTTEDCNSRQPVGPCETTTTTTPPTTEAPATTVPGVVVTPPEPELGPATSIVREVAPEAVLEVLESAPVPAPARIAFTG